MSEKKYFIARKLVLIQHKTNETITNWGKETTSGTVVHQSALLKTVGISLITLGGKTKNCRDNISLGEMMVDEKKTAECFNLNFSKRGHFLVKRKRKIHRFLPVAHDLIRCNKYNKGNLFDVNHFFRNRKKF